MENQPTLAQWRTLFDAAKAFRGLAPWEWMNDADVFGVLSPLLTELGIEVRRSSALPALEEEKRSLFASLERR